MISFILAKSTSNPIQDLVGWFGLVILAGGSLVGMPKVLRWLGRHIADDVTKAVFGPLDERLNSIETKANNAASLAAATAERIEFVIGTITPNGGTSLADKIADLLKQVNQVEIKARNAERESTDTARRIETLVKQLVPENDVCLADKIAILVGRFDALEAERRSDDRNVQ